jgi:hypothetical protein
MKKILISLFAIILLSQSTAFAHQPRIPDGDDILVTDPEISKAYYSKLDGTPHTYTISSDVSFLLYVNLLVPDIEGQKKDVSAKIIKDGDIESPIAVLDGKNFEWTKFFEPFGYDSYFMGPEYEEKVDAGKYEITVYSDNNDSKYSLAVGKLENFDFKEIVNALNLVPEIKRDFFGEYPANFIFSPFGWGFVLIMFLFSFIVGFACKFILKKRGNIGRTGRLLRLLISVSLFAIAIMTSWSPILLFFSGYALFEAMFGWCVVYAAMGKR